MDGPITMDLRDYDHEIELKFATFKPVERGRLYLLQPPAAGMADVARCVEGISQWFLDQGARVAVLGPDVQVEECDDPREVERLRGLLARALDEWHKDVEFEQCVCHELDCRCEFEDIDEIRREAGLT